MSKRLRKVTKFICFIIIIFVSLFTIFCSFFFINQFSLFSHFFYSFEQFFILFYYHFFLCFAGISLSPPVDAGCFTWFWYIVTLPLVFMFWCTVADVRKPGNRKYAHLTFMTCLCWMGFFSYFMVSWVETVGATAGIPSVIMGLTFLAAGTSVPDMFSAVIVAQQGFGDKAVSSTIGSNVFDINIALGLPWLLFIIIYQESVIVIADGFLISIIILFVTLFALVLTVRFVNWSLPKWTGYFFILLYCVFVAQQLGRTTFNGDC